MKVQPIETPILFIFFRSHAILAQKLRNRRKISIAVGPDFSLCNWPFLPLLMFSLEGAYMAAFSQRAHSHLGLHASLPSASSICFEVCLIKKGRSKGHHIGCGDECLTGYPEAVSWWGPWFWTLEKIHCIFQGFLLESFSSYRILRDTSGWFWNDISRGTVWHPWNVWARNLKSYVSQVCSKWEKKIEFWM